MLELDIVLNDPILCEVYRRGIKQGTRRWARLKDGKQVIGFMEYDLNEVFQEIDRGEYDK